jgi:poly(ADP-ribose) glycohydrolase ARH3
MGDAIGSVAEGYDPFTIVEVFGILRHCAEPSHYTDDTQMFLGLVKSLTELGSLSAEHVAKTHSDMFEPSRGYGSGAMNALEGVKDGKDYRKTATMVFPDGSFGNGSAMQIGPIGLAFRHASPSVFMDAIRGAVLSTHVHPATIDAAFCLAWMVRSCTCVDVTKVKEFGPRPWLVERLQEMRLHCVSDEMKEKLVFILKEFENEKASVIGTDEIKNVFGTGDPLEALDDASQSYALDFLRWYGHVRKEKLCSSFQIKAIEAVALILYTFVWNWDSPFECMTQIFHCGGDTDTTMCMMGYIVGALHGTSWIPKNWWDSVENGKLGKDYIVGMAQKIAQLDLFDYSFEEDVKE